MTTRLSGEVPGSIGVVWIGPSFWLIRVGSGGSGMPMSYSTACIASRRGFDSVAGPPGTVFSGLNSPLVSTVTRMGRMFLGVDELAATDENVGVPDARLALG